ncbi:MAG: FAD-dependent oxidoreductase [Alphaproteobacteria bacterium]|nr:FAD-dependent oxidoreductase [Alphaproteobacteria bacterium]
MAHDFPHLFTPLSIRGKTLKNRITFGAHTANMAEDGLPGERHQGYYSARAKGGAGMIVVEPVPAHRTGVLTRGNFRHEDDSIIPAFCKLNDACHAHGAVMIHQIYHIGAHGDGDNSWEPNWSPSGTPSHHDSDGSHAMSEAEIEEMIEAFVQAARRDHEAGFDGIELFAAYNALIDQFWSPLTNLRTDQWGRSLENRLRFTVRIIEGIRNATDDAFIIGMAISGAEPYPGGLSVADKQEIIAWLDERGLIDYVTVGAGSYLNDFAHIVPSFMTEPMLGPPVAAEMKKAVKHAKIQAEARIRTPANGEQVIADDQADMVSLVRAQIADPELANKARDGRPEDIRLCINCNQQCIGRRLRDYWISCLVNPATGREVDWGEASPAADLKHVLVIGGGPAGMEAARVAAERGHRVTLVEKSQHLGGRFRLAAKQPKRHEIADFLAWLERQLTKHQVEIRRATALGVDEIRAIGADEIILATGSRPPTDGFQRALPHIRKLPGVDLPHVTSAEDALDDKATLGKRVLLIDDDHGWRGVGAALYLANKGHAITILTSNLHPGQAIAHTASVGLMMKDLTAAEIDWIASSAALAIEESAVRIRNLLTSKERAIETDSVVLATSPSAETGLAADLEKAGLVTTAIGDCVAPRKASMAIYEGRRVALAV